MRTLSENIKIISMSLRNMYKSETLASASQYYIYRQRSYIAFTLRQKHKTMANLFKKSVSSVVITVFHGVICKIYTVTVSSSRST